MNPCEAVRRTTAAVVASAARVQIVESKLFQFAAKLENITHLQPPLWDEGDWHYNADAAADGPLTAQYVMILSCLNWCFWPSTTSMEYDTLASSLKRVLEADPTAFSSDKLKRVTTEMVRSWFAPHDMPNAEERARVVREVGYALQ